MSLNDPSLLQDFLTEAGELVEQLDADLVKLEQTTDAAESRELLNSIFRALHTVKGAAGFLGLTEVITFAHAAEDALNRLRKGEVGVTPAIMDTLLKSTDVLRQMVESLAAGEAVEPCPPALMNQLHAITSSDGPAAADLAPAADAPADADDAGGTLNLPPQKRELLPFMIEDMHLTVAQIGQTLASAANVGHESAAAMTLGDLADSLGKTTEFFELSQLSSLVGVLKSAAAHLADIPAAVRKQLLPRLGAIVELINRQADALAHMQVLAWPLDMFLERIDTLLEGRPLDEALAAADLSPEQVLALDGVIIAAPAAAEPSADGAAESAASSSARRPAASPGDQTIRVEVGRLETILNMVGQLVLTKNRFLGLTRRLRDHALPHDVLEDMAGAANDLDRLSGNLQMAVMRTRMQPMSKLFDRYPRVIRDIARKTGKEITLELAGKETEVDKSVLELLADPLVHILRNSADHGIESPQRRRELGKPAAGTVRLAAEHQGSHVRVEIHDDGKGLDRELLAAKAIERGLTTPEQVATMSDSQVFQFIFAAGFSTAEQVSDLSGRGVGMDVVRTNIARLNGSINLASTKGQGTTIEILIPLTVAIMPAMVVRIGRHLYAIPLTSIVEIVRPERTMLHSVTGEPVMALRDCVLPLVNMRRRLGEADDGIPSRISVVIGVGSQRAGLMVDQVIGQQEVVIKPLDDSFVTGGPFSGSTIREDGEVSLILDVIQLLRDAQPHERAAA